MYEILAITHIFIKKRFSIIRMILNYRAVNFVISSRLTLTCQRQQEVQQLCQYNLACWEQKIIFSPVFQTSDYCFIDENMNVISIESVQG
jgi:inner membrane protein involved in colicin E2 resistance